MMTYGVVMVVLAVACTVWMRRVNVFGGASARAYMRDFLERSGYRHLDLREAPIEAQVERSLELAARQAKGDCDTHMLRAVEGTSIHWRQWTRLTGSGYAMGCQWSVPLVGPPHALLHVVDRRLIGAGKVIKELFTNSRRELTPRFTARTGTGDPAFDERFVVFCQDANAAQRVLSNGALRAQLLACAEVDLVVGETDITFSDPSMANQRALAGYDAATTMQVHDRMATILRSMVAAVQ